MNRALDSVVRPTYADLAVEEYGIIPALIAVGAAAVPMFTKKSDDKKAKKIALQNIKQQKLELEAKKRSNMVYYVGGGVAVVALVTVIILATRKRGKKK